MSGRAARNPKLRGCCWMNLSRVCTHWFCLDCSCRGRCPRGGAGRAAAYAASLQSATAAASVGIASRHDASRRGAHCQTGAKPATTQTTCPRATSTLMPQPFTLPRLTAPRTLPRFTPQPRTVPRPVCRRKRPRPDGLRRARQRRTYAGASSPAAIAITSASRPAPLFKAKWARAT